MTRSEMIEKVTGRLIKTYHPKAIYLFGSFAWGKPDMQSDLDMLIVVERSEEKPYKRAIRGIEALMGLKVAKDIIVYTEEEFESLSSDISTLSHKIKMEGIKLYEST